MSGTNPKTDLKTRDVVGSKDEEWRKTSLLDRNEVALRDNLFTDVCFIVGTEKKRIPAIRSILSLGSSVFATMLSERWSSDGNEIPVPDIVPDAFYELLRFIYCEKVALSKYIVLPLFYAADKYDVQELKNKCIDFLKTSLTPSNVCYYLYKARELGATDLMNLCFEKLSTAATTAIYLCPHDDEVNFCFHDLDIETICCILEMDTLAIEEVDLFKSMLGWAKFKCRVKLLDSNTINLRRVLEPALPLIRFRLMSPEEFTGVVSSSGILSIEEELSVFKYLNSKPRPENLRPTPRFQKLINIWICEEKSGEKYNVQVKCSDTVAELRQEIKEHKDDVTYLLELEQDPSPFQFKSCGRGGSPFGSAGTFASPSPAFGQTSSFGRRAHASTGTVGITDTDVLKHENVRLENSRLLSDYGIRDESIILLQPIESQERQIIREARPGALQNEANKLKPCHKIY